MTKRIWVLFLAFLGCASTQPPRAAATAPAKSPRFEVGPGPYNVDLDAGPGRYEERFIQVPDGAFALKGFIQFITVSKDKSFGARIVCFRAAISYIRRMGFGREQTLANGTPAVYVQRTERSAAFGPFAVGRDRSLRNKRVTERSLSLVVNFPEH
jgi:hypothetical protein